MGNFNIEYNSANVYNNSKESELENEEKLLPPPPKTDSNVAYVIIDTNFDSFGSPGVASKQTCVVVQSKPMTKVDEMLNEMHVDL